MDTPTPGLALIEIRLQISNKSRTTGWLCSGESVNAAEEKLILCSYSDRRFSEGAIEDTRFSPSVSPRDAVKSNRLDLWSFQIKRELVHPWPFKCTVLMLKAKRSEIILSAKRIVNNISVSVLVCLEFSPNTLTSQTASKNDGTDVLKHKRNSTLDL